MFTNVTLLYFLLLIPLSGFIAWTGDRIGHKSGKKRHSLFGMRPRHTAMLFTIGAGVCISLVSFGSVWALSETFRIVLRDGVSLVRKNHDLKYENRRLVSGNASLRRETDYLAGQADVSRRQAAASATEAKKADALRDAAVLRWRQAQAQVQRADNELARETRAFNDRQADLNEARFALSSLKVQLGVKAVELTTARQRVAAAERQVGDARRRVADATEKASVAVQNLARVRQSADDALKVQQKNLADLRQQLTDQTKLYDDQSQKIVDQRKALEQVNLQVAAGQHDLAQIRVNIDALRGHQITYQVGEEVNRIAIRPGYNIWRIETILGAFLNTTGARAEARGAGHAHDGDERAVIILPKVLAGDGAGDEPRVATEDDSVHAAADAIRRANVEVVVIANATANAVSGEPVPVEFKIFRNPVVIAADTRITETSIDGTGSRQQIAKALDDFLKQKVRRSLLQAGIIPPARGGEMVEAATLATAAGGAAPEARESAEAGHEPGDGNGGGAAMLVTISNDEWLQIMDRVREAGTRARVVAVAAADMRAGDPVNLRFEVKGGYSGAQSAIMRGEAGF